eukprot:TRINITY_DN6865_c0_g1_i5.p1 TRINITY_DN6865_c0_g1~~TRINITY_DN6865_c0_g1_i5.p1  ORF type:complete len:206 (+),score=27.37 TRINITY_DN6865_c0_g1_i5:67-684(+)
MCIRDRDKRAGNLSGGNKRKLNVSLALIGGPSIQFFDEPSTGLDPYARRCLWETLQTNIQQKKATIILTTHQMVEAESLSNKIGILVNGKFVCVGSVSELKRRFGSGYKLNIKKNDEEHNNSQNIDSIIKSSIPTAQKLVSENDNYLSYQVPLDNFSMSSTFELLYDRLKKNGEIKDFSISNCTLEQIFLHFSRQQVSEEDKVIS